MEKYKYSDITAVVTKIVDLLGTLETADRHRVIRASLTLLGDSDPTIKGGWFGPVLAESIIASVSTPKATNWMQKHNFVIADLESIFDIDNGAVDIITSDIPGNSKKDRTLNTYAMVGIKELIKNGEAKFEDSIARELCEHFGCYDPANHSVYIKKSNWLTGSKKGGWRLTGPGFEAAALLVKQMVKQMATTNP